MPLRDYWVIAEILLLPGILRSYVAIRCSVHYLFSDGDLHSLLILVLLSGEFWLFPLFYTSHVVTDSTIR